MRLRILSSAVEGAERGALFGANNAGFRTGGWVPRGVAQIAWNEEPDEDGDPPWVGLLGLSVSKYRDHWICAKRNIDNADGVLLIGSRNTQNAELAIRRCQKTDKPLLKLRYHWKQSTPNGMLRDARLLAAWIWRHEIRKLCVTGDKNQDSPGVAGYTERLMLTTAYELNNPGSLPEEAQETVRERRYREAVERRKQKRLASWPKAKRD
jgi:hypothetical protein